MVNPIVGIMNGHDLGGRVALVTGAGRGIGRAIAHRLLVAGARVSIVDIDDHAARDAAEEYAGLGRIIAVHADVSDEDAVIHAVAATALGLGGLDILVNNAGVSHPVNAPLASLALADWRRIIDTNLTSAMLTVKHAAPHLGQRGGQRGGNVVNIASTRALQSEPHTEAYCAAKGGLVALTHAMAMSLGPGIRVNCISPGWIATSEWQPRGHRSPPELRARDHAQHPAGRVGRPEDVAELCAYLVSDAAGFVTGQNYVIDGGMTRKMIYEE